MESRYNFCISVLNFFCYILLHKSSPVLYNFGFFFFFFIHRLNRFCVFQNNDNHQRTLKMDSVLTRVTVFQASEYHGIVPLLDVQRYLNSVRYIEELQKFLEDDHYKWEFVMVSRKSSWRFSTDRVKRKYISVTTSRINSTRRGESQNLERRNVERRIFRNFKTANIKITK